MDTLLPTVSLYAPDLIGVVLPPIIELFNKDIKNESQRFLVSFATCFLAAFFLKYNSLAGGNPEALLTSFGIIFAESQVVYKLYFKNSFIRATMVERLNRPEVDEAVG